MGDLSTKFEEQKRNLSEMERMHEPDAATQRHDYIEFRKKQRKALRTLNNFKTVLRDGRYRLEQVKNGYIKAGAENVYNSKIKETASSNGYRAIFSDYLKLHHPNVWGLLSPAEQLRLSGDKKLFTEKINGFVSAGLITQADLDEGMASYLVFSTRNMNDDQQKAFLDGLEETLEPGQKNELLGNINSYVDPVDIPENEREEYPYRPRIQELRTQIPADVQNDPDKLKRYNDVLDFADLHLGRSKSEVRSERRAEEKDGQHIESVMTDRFVSTELDTFEDGRFKDIQKIPAEHKYISVTAPERQKDLEDALQAGVELSDRTKEGIKLILDKMEKMGLEEYPYNPSGEDGSKIYAFNKLYEEKNALEKALESGKADDIIRCGEAYKKTCADMDELYSLAKEYLNDDPYVFAGNMDSIRNEKIPYEYTKDLKTTAHINTLFNTYIGIKTKGLDKEEYIQNPNSAFVNSVMSALQPISFAATTEGLSLEECIDAMSRQGNFADSEIKLLAAAPPMLVKRNLALALSLEKDPQKRKANYAHIHAVNEAMDSVHHSESGKYNYFNGSFDNSLRTGAKKRTIENLILARDEDRLLNSMIAGVPQTDYLGRVIGPAFDRENYLKKKPVDYAGIMDRAERLVNKARKMEAGDKSGLSADEVLDAMQQLYLDVLITHNDEKSKPEYKKLQNSFLVLADRLSSAASEEMKQRMRAQQEAYRENYAKDKEKAWEIRGFAEHYKMIQTVDGMISLLPDGPKKFGYADLKSRLLSRSIEDPEAQALKERAPQMEGYAPYLGKIKGYNDSLIFENALGENDIEIFETALNNISNDLEEFKKGIGEPKAVEAMEDLLKFAKLDSVKMMTIMAESPYLVNLLTLNTSAIRSDGKQYSIDEAVRGLGSIYYDHRNLLHYCNEEVRLEYEHREKLEALKAAGAKWSEKDEADYAEDIKRSHAEVIKSFDRLMKVKDPAKNDAYYQNTLEHDLGTAADKDRNICRHVGVLRGELKALENGWDTEHRYVLGFMGGIEAEMERMMRYDPDKLDKDQLAAFKKDFGILRNNCYNTHVENNADKKAICEQISAFKDKYRNNPIMKHDLVNCFEQSEKKLLLAAAKTEAADYKANREKSIDPVGYLKKLETAGDVKKFTRAMMDVEDRLARGEFASEEMRVAYQQYRDEFFTTDDNMVPVKNTAFLKEFQKEIYSYLTEQSVYVSRRAEATAEDIRSGRHGYSKALGDLGADYKASLDLAYNIEGRTEAGRKLDTAKQLFHSFAMGLSGAIFDGKPWLNTNDDSELKKEYGEKAHDGLNNKERERMISAVKNTMPSITVREKYGIKIEADGKLTIPEAGVIEQKAAEIKAAAAGAAVDFMSAFMEQRNKAVELFERLKVLKAAKATNTPEFMGMYNNLEDVTKLNVYNTPDQIAEALERADTAAKIYYKAKRIDSKFAGRHGNGLQRVELSEDISAYVENTSRILTEKTTADIDPASSVVSQTSDKTALAQKNDKHRKMEASEIKKMFNPEPGPRRMSVGSPDVKAKKETVTEHEGVEKGRKSSARK